jgi:gentisate 1,2-dioxygenase
MSTAAPSDEAAASAARAARVRIHEYSVAAAVELPVQPCASFPAALHEARGASRAVALDISAALGVGYAATSPNLLAHFIALNAGDAPLAAAARCTAQAFFCLRGAGSTSSAEHGRIAWRKGDLFVLPGPFGALAHAADADCGEAGAALYAISDEPLLRYLGVQACEARFGAAFYSREVLLGAVEAVRHEPGAEHRNRMGVLLSNEAVQETKTLSPVLWALLNVLPARTKQPPHRHQSVAVDLCVSVAPGAEGLVYTLMGPELDEAGWVRDPVRMEWASGAVFTTPPGWWHSHHNESGEDAWVLPTQDAGLFTHQRTLDIRFSHAKPQPAGSGGR